MFGTNTGRYYLPPPNLYGKKGVDMNLTDITIKAAYDSDYDDVLNDFYIPALSISNEYCRLAGFFSSSALAVAARGMHKFFKSKYIVDISYTSYVSFNIG